MRACFHTEASGAEDLRQGSNSAEKGIRNATLFGLVELPLQRKIAREPVGLGKQNTQ